MTRTFSRFWRADGLSAVCILVISIIVSGSAIGCEYGPDVTWVNQTDENIVIYLSDELSSDLGTHLPPQSTKTEFLGDDLWKGLVVVRDEQGNVLYRQELTWDEFKAIGYRFVITEDMLSPTSAATSAAALGSAADPQNVQNVITYLPRGIAQLRTCR